MQGIYLTDKALILSHRDSLVGIVMVYGSTRIIQLNQNKYTN